MVTYREEKLFEAIHKGDLDAVKEAFNPIFLFPAVDVNCHYYHDETPLISAVCGKNVDIVKFLLEKKANVNLAGADGRSPFLWAASWGNFDMMKLLMNAGADIYATDNAGKNALYYLNDSNSIDKKQCETAERYLIECGVKPNIMLSCGRSMLEDAIVDDNENYARYLLEKGGFSEQSQLQSALCLAMQRNMSELGKELVKTGVDVNVTGGYDKTTPLMSAAYNGDMEMVKFLISAGADIHKKDKNGATVMKYAAGSGQVEMVQFFEEKGIALDEPDNQGSTPFMYAAFCEKREMLTYLANRGVNIDAQDKDGYTAFIWAARHGRINRLEMLNELGVDIKIKNNDGESALLLAMNRQEKEVLDFFLDSELVQYNPRRYQRTQAEQVKNALNSRTVEQLKTLPQTDPDLWQKTITLRQLSVLIQLLPESEHIKIYEQAQGVIDKDEKERLKNLIRSKRGASKD